MRKKMLAGFVVSVVLLLVLVSLTGAGTASAKGKPPTKTPVPTDTPSGPTDTPEPTDTPGPTSTPTNTPEPGGDLYVEPSGNCGSLTPCYTTIQAAVNAASAGSTIHVMNGTYNEKVTFGSSGSAADGYITLQNYSGHSPIVDGTGLSTSGTTGMLYMENKSYIKIIGLEIRNFQAGGDSGSFNAGIWVRGYGSHIEIRDNNVHDIENSCSSCGAHGIAVYGTNGSTSISDVIVDGNEVWNLQTGWSESMVFNGNVDGFTASNNTVHDNDNIGIDMIGYEGECPDPDYDRARNGVCVGNLVYNIDALGNPAYGNDRCADGIYVDGGTNILIEQNIVHHSNIGIELASEHKDRSTSYITVRNNFVSYSHMVGMCFGGYAKNTGSAEYNVIAGNTFYHNDTDNGGYGEINVQHHTLNNIFKNNIMVASSQNTFITSWGSDNVGDDFDYNLYYSPGGPDGSSWAWQKKYYGTFTEWKNGTGFDANSIFADPLLVDPANGDLHIGSGSAAIDAGETLGSSVIGTEDIDGDARVQGGAVDIGADERE
jgi:hypothetical protein